MVTAPFKLVVQRILMPSCVFLLLALVTACTTYVPHVNNTEGRATVYQDVNSPGLIQGIGIESQDIVSMTDRMMRDMLANPVLAGRNPSPRVIVDSEYFRNEGSTPINKNLITDRLRVELNRAANGRMLFIGRHYSDMVAKERDLKRQGLATEGTIGSARAQAGGDFRLGGRIASQDLIQVSSGMASRYNQVTFEMVELETGLIVWSGMYELSKAAANDVVYR